ncbi:hypothetical protein C8R42DRAFT_739368 [Lentinula raphanica]|nr:hypothetical protein C8R42DRAFT_739368 [Lentinula raphanica]
MEPELAMEIPILQLSCQLLPLFPTSCPYFTAAGVTKHVLEVAIDFSGGGFSNDFSRPAYLRRLQLAAFFETFPNGMFAGSFNPSIVKWLIIWCIVETSFLITPSNGRIVSLRLSQMLRPVAAQTDNFQVVIGSETGLHRRNIWHDLSFKLHRHLSQALCGFTDITSGNAPGCSGLNSTYIFFFWGFNLKATVGWDPVSSWSRYLLFNGNVEGSTIYDTSTQILSAIILNYNRYT